MAEFDLTPALIDREDRIVLVERILENHNRANDTHWTLADDWLPPDDWSPEENNYLVVIPDEDITPPWYVLRQYYRDLIGVDEENPPPVAEGYLRMFRVWPYGDSGDRPPMTIVVDWNKEVVVAMAI